MSKKMDFNKYLKGLYDMAGKDMNDNGLSWQDEKELKKMANDSKKFMARNKDIFEEGEPKFKTCTRYNPCPICDKCLNKASHLYVECQECQIPICTHTYKDKVFMIRRDNFKLSLVSKNVFK